MQLPLPPSLQVGPEGHAICALSGGVDSSVAATLVHKVLGDRLHKISDLVRGRGDRGSGTGERGGRGGGAGMQGYQVAFTCDNTLK